MKLFAKMLFIALAHVAFVFIGYGTGMFGLAKHLPYGAVIVLWLVASTVAAGFGYYRLCVNLAGAIGATLVSLFVGVFLAFNTYGT